MPLRALENLERQIGRQLRFIELKRGAIGRRIGWRLRDFEQKNLNRDEFRFLRTWIEKPLTVGAVAPSGKALARVMAGYVDPAARPDRGARSRHRPGDRSVGRARHRSCPAHRWSNSIRNSARCLRQRFPGATVVQGDAYSLRQTLDGVLREPAAAFVSGLPLFNKPLKMRLDLLDQAFGLMQPDAPFVQFTYNAISPIPRSHGRVRAEASGARVAKFPARACLGVPDQSWRGGQTTESAYSVLCRPSLVPMSAPKILVIAGLAPQRVLQCAAGRAGDQGADACRCRRHPHFARRLSAADLRRRPRRTVGAAATTRCKLKQFVGGARGVFIASPEYNASITPLLKNTIDWISTVREAWRGAACRVPEPRLRARRRLARALRRAEFAADVAAGAGDRLPRAGGAGAGRDPERRAGVQRG